MIILPCIQSRGQKSSQEYYNKYQHDCCDLDTLVRRPLGFTGRQLHVTELHEKTAYRTFEEMRGDSRGKKKSLRIPCQLIPPLIKPAVPSGRTPPQGVGSTMSSPQRSQTIQVEAQCHLRGLFPLKADLYRSSWVGLGFFWKRAGTGVYDN